ncbi:uncharacterized protein C8Q71DRAFT_862302 [Rhodofomes roseus]|uniref:Uncharacterized protein n=1 Tax=Rhodofomes roseus TaxID=34475 RepID=A0ABQ8K2A0_9APHY|nr:uncharacterized protein C8Q71DRAFT_862302 [Rhodofomes roseus]KAH9830860.1 hypothetical protein C8Q71DRAFT_862302 [Rhodofomes roseus]
MPSTPSFVFIPKPSLVPHLAVNPPAPTSVELHNLAVIQPHLPERGGDSLVARPDSSHALDSSSPMTSSAYISRDPRSWCAIILLVLRTALDFAEASARLPNDPNRLVTKGERAWPVCTHPACTTVPRTIDGPRARSIEPKANFDWPAMFDFVVGRGRHERISMWPCSSLLVVANVEERCSRDSQIASTLQNAVVHHAAFHPSHPPFPPPPSSVQQPTPAPYSPNMSNAAERPRVS